MDTIIFDIDGTLADVSHRRHYVTGGGRKNWDVFFKEMVNDPPLADVCMLAELLGTHPNVESGDLHLFLFSGRPDSHRKETEAWLTRYVHSYWAHAEALLMRAEGDYRPDTEVKREMLQKIRGQGYDVRLVVDDRPSVIEMWKEEGVTVLAHDSGEWETVQKTWAPGELHMMVGPSGAGKSSFVKGQAWDEAPGMVLSSDALRISIAGTLRDQSVNSQVYAAMHAVAKARIENGLDVVIDATNLHARDRRAFRDLCPQDTKIHYHVIDRPLAAKHHDAGWRDEVVINGVKLIDKHHQTFQSAIKHILRGDDDPRVTVHDCRRNG